MAHGDQLLDVPASADAVSPRPIRRGVHVRGLVADIEQAVAKYAAGCHCSRVTASRRALEIARALAGRMKATARNASPTRREMTDPPLIRKW